VQKASMILGFRHGSEKQMWVWRQAQNGQYPSLAVAKSQPLTGRSRPAVSYRARISLTIALIFSPDYQLT
jgi:hypothetical protein